MIFENLQDLFAQPGDIQVSHFDNYLGATRLYAQELFKEEVKSRENIQRGKLRTRE